MRRLCEFDNAAWTEMVNRYFDRIYRWCLDGGLGPHAAADVSQEVFVSALGSMHRFQRDDSSSLSGWLRRICQRRIADHLRRREEVAMGGTDAVKFFSQLIPIQQSVYGLDKKANELDVDDTKVLAAIAIAQSEFEETTWRAFWMSTVDGFSTTETAFELGLTKNAVYLSKSRITKRLRQILEAPNSDGPRL